MIDRRTALAGVVGAAAFASRPARAQSAALIEPDGAALTLARFHPAGGALDRHVSRPGAWWQLVYAVLLPAWPVELSLRTLRRGHALRLVAMDAPPAEGPSIAVALPLVADASEAPVRWSSRFVLPARSPVDGLFLLVELWRADFAAPPPLTMRLRSAAPVAEPRPAASPSARVEAPPSPLTLAQRERAAFELPVFAPRVPEARP